MLKHLNGKKILREKFLNLNVLKRQVLCTSTHLSILRPGCPVAVGKGQKTLDFKDLEESTNGPNRYRVVPCTLKPNLV